MTSSISNARPGRIAAAVGAGVAAILLYPSDSSPSPQPPAAVDGRQTAPVFRAAVNRVTLFATVRDSRGRLVPNLSAADFELLGEGTPLQIVDFRSDGVPVSLALLLDVSGSMAVGANLDRAKLAGQQLVERLEPGADEGALFAFDTELRELRAFSTSLHELPGSLEGARPFGATSLWDAIAAAARQVAERGSQRRALVVLTDGIDTRSRWRAEDVSGLASSIDVPVYIIATASPVRADRMRNLTDLARWTGGDLFPVTTLATAAAAADQIVEELRQQYFIAFDASATPGWHPLVVRVRDRRVHARARSGYFVER